MRASRAAFTRDVLPPKLLPRRPHLSPRRSRMCHDPVGSTASRFPILKVSVVSSMFPSLSRTRENRTCSLRSRFCEDIGEGKILGALLRAYEPVGEDDARGFPSPSGT